MRLVVITTAVLAGLGTLRGQDRPLAFERDVLPTLEARCFSCHQGIDKRGRTRRPKAGLRLDGRGWIERGSNDGKVLRPGQAEQSLLYTVTVLPEDHEDRMPAKGKPLTEAETEALRRWIDAGADFGDWVGRKGPAAPAALAPDATTPPPAALLQLEQLAQGLRTPDARAIERLSTQHGAQVTAVHPGSPLLRVAFRSREADTGDAAIAALQPLREHISHLYLGGTQAGDAALATVAKLPRLMHLELQRTAVGDAGLRRLAGLRHLRVLNLYGTEVSDRGLAELEALPSLRHVHLWQSRATRQGAAALQEALPSARVHFGLELPAPPPPNDDEADRPGARRRRRR